MEGDSAKARCGASCWPQRAWRIRFTPLNARALRDWRYGMRRLPFAWVGNGRFFGFGSGGFRRFYGGIIS